MQETLNTGVNALSVAVFVMYNLIQFAAQHRNHDHDHDHDRYSNPCYGTYKRWEVLIIFKGALFKSMLSRHIYLKEDQEN